MSSCESTVLGPTSSYFELSLLALVATVDFIIVVRLIKGSQNGFALLLCATVTVLIAAAIAKASG